ncbi:hypothetical protein BCR36DRAFT_31433 [Piromyces finnis]|uniref:Uncharacterized protein n=1 Tax=Piromyces finnis TaxID=1754191 RepID=A0A1Y1VDD2_9FUNG|nr:hypothetical protein BCR36DRAFT_31433 [Piromyces finnis]|eukprot:ORX52571.1 hypothetical protein BCR36DRAFT_31433 [Piromyces finnis]
MSNNNSPVEENKNEDNNDINNPLKISNTKMANLSTLKMTAIGESTASLTSVNHNDHRHSGYYYDDEDPVQQLDEAFTNITDDIENYSEDDDSDQDMFNNGKVKRRSKFKNTFIKH